MPAARHRHRRLPALAAASVAIAVVATGCGGDSERESYEQAWEAAVAEAAASADAIPSAEAIDPGDEHAIADGYAALGELSLAQAELLAEIEPPADIAAEHEGYVELLRAAGMAYEEGAPKIRKAADPQELEAELRAMISVISAPDNVTPLTDFTRALEDGGYEIGLSSTTTGAVPPATP